MTIVSPSLLAAIFLELSKEIDMINRSNAEWLHLDIMDGVYVPNISFGFPILDVVSNRCKKRLDVHLMTDNPMKYIKEMSKFNAWIISVHIENSENLHKIIDEIHNSGIKAGVMINPSTPVSHLNTIISELDMVGIMAVNPGFGGQVFINNTFNKVIELKNLICQTSSKALIEVDGGVNDLIGRKLVNRGADVLVAGSSIFNALDPKERIDLLHNL